MERKKFEAVLMLLVPQVLDLITEEGTIDEISAHKMFYESRLYTLLEQEKTKLWHLSPHMLYQMFEEERKTGSITFPEEA